MLRDIAYVIGFCLIMWRDRFASRMLGNLELELVTTLLWVAALRFAPTEW